MKSTVVNAMRPGYFLAVVLFCALPAIASAQAWAEAFRARDYETAADLLQQVITYRESGQDFASLLPEYRQLALMYANGFGVVKDPFAACMMANWADAATKKSASKLGSDVGAYEAAVSESERFVATHCDQLTETDRMDAGSMTGCFAFGMGERIEQLGGRTIRIDRRGIEFADSAPGHRELLTCPQLVAHVRVTSLEPPPDAAAGVKTRHFIELFVWELGRSVPASALRWEVYEVRDKLILAFQPQPLVTRTGWPERGFPSDVERGLTLEMLPSGAVQWRLEGESPKVGWITKNAMCTYIPPGPRHDPRWDPYPVTTCDAVILR
jgi:hypothetical protein